MSGYFALAPRPLLPEDAAGAHQLLINRLGVTPYFDRADELLNVAERGGDEEHRALVIARDRTVAGLALFGRIAGTESGFRLHALVVESIDRDVGDRLIGAILNAVISYGGTFLVGEFADEPALTTTIALLREHGFEDAGRIPDYYRDGVPLVILRRHFS
jgi:ribosomal protein S18 acetylase RimI-like enzyme